MVFFFSIDCNLVIYIILIPNPYDYHNKDIETGVIFNLFFDINSSTGYHPEPNIFNLIFTLLMGVLIGFIIWRFIKLKIRKRFANTVYTKLHNLVQPKPYYNYQLK